MEKTLKQIEAEYFNNTVLVEVLDKAEIEKMASSKTSSCWHAGEKIDEGWVILATPSTVSKDDKHVVYVCREENYSEPSMQ